MSQPNEGKHVLAPTPKFMFSVSFVLTQNNATKAENSENDFIKVSSKTKGKIGLMKRAIQGAGLERTETVNHKRSVHG